MGADDATEGSDVQGKLVCRGKVKEVYDRGEPDRLHFRFTDNISVFDKMIPSTIPRKGESLCRTSAFWFSRCGEMGIRTHFISMPSTTTMEVQRVEVISDLSRIDRDTRNFLIPLEFICRHYIAGSLHDRLRSGEVEAERVGLKPGKTPPYGEKLPKPFVECTTKLEKVDRPLSGKEAREMAGLSDDEYDGIVDAALRIDAEIAATAGANGLIHVDGKKEFAFDGDRRLMVIDTFGTADEDRFWDREKYFEGEFLELSKEMVRQHYRSIGYHERLMLARKEGREEEPMPPLPKDMIDEVSKLYGELFERITGEEF